MAIAGQLVGFGLFGFAAVCCIGFAIKLCERTKLFSRSEAAD